MQSEKRDLNGWVKFLTNTEIPILKQTLRDLKALRESDNTSAHDISKVVARDPMMTALLLRYLQGHKHKSQTSEVMETEQALLMLGLEPFFKNVMHELTVEDLLGKTPQALIATLKVVHRSHRASTYAFDWAVRRRDLHFEEIRVAGLLRDMTEILMWCFAPGEMQKIKAMQDQDKHLRSGIAQEDVFGFKLVSLQQALVTEWKLPQLLLTLINAEHANQPRVKNVVLADRLTRHSSHGWDDAALPDDYKEIAGLLNMKVEDVEEIVRDDKPT